MSDLGYKGSAIGTVYTKGAYSQNITSKIINVSTEMNYGKSGGANVGVAGNLTYQDATPKTGKKFGMVGTSATGKLGWNNDQEGLFCKGSATGAIGIIPTNGDFYTRSFTADGKAGYRFIKGMPKDNQPPKYNSIGLFLEGNKYPNKPHLSNIKTGIECSTGNGAKELFIRGGIEKVKNLKTSPCIEAGLKFPIF